jgi:hypothetical protein
MLPLSDLRYAYCLVKLNCPALNGPVQLFVPEYVPAIVEAVGPAAVPVIVAPQVGNPNIDPAGTWTVNDNDVPDAVPDSVPVKLTIPSSVAAVTGPDSEEPDWEIVHVILPLPVESEAVPEYVPLRLAVSAVGGVGPELPTFEPPQPIHIGASATAHTSCGRNDLPT